MEAFRTRVIQIIFKLNKKKLKILFNLEIILINLEIYYIHLFLWNL